MAVRPAHQRRGIGSRFSSAPRSTSRGRRARGDRRPQAPRLLPALRLRSGPRVRPHDQTTTRPETPSSSRSSSGRARERARTGPLCPGVRRGGPGGPRGSRAALSCERALRAGEAGRVRPARLQSSGQSARRSTSARPETTVVGSVVLVARPGDRRRVAWRSAHPVGCRRGRRSGALPRERASTRRGSRWRCGRVGSATSDSRARCTVKPWWKSTPRARHRDEDRLSIGERGVREQRLPASRRRCVMKRRKPSFVRGRARIPSARSRRRRRQGDPRGDRVGLDDRPVRLILMRVGLASTRLLVESLVVPEADPLDAEQRGRGARRCVDGR